MCGSEAPGDFERFIETEEGRDWLAWHGWVRVSDVFERALIVPVASDDILEDALVMVMESGKTGDVGTHLHERGMTGRVALVLEEQAESVKTGPGSW